MTRRLEEAMNRAALALEKAEMRAAHKLAENESALTEARSLLEAKMIPDDATRLSVIEGLTDIINAMKEWSEASQSFAQAIGTLQRAQNALEN